MSTPNFSNLYPDLTEYESDPRYLLLCTQQTKAVSTLNAKHAQQRLSLLIAIRREAADSERRGEL